MDLKEEQIAIDEPEVNMEESEPEGFQKHMIEIKQEEIYDPDR